MPIRRIRVDTARQWLAGRAFDLVYAPGVQPDDANRYNVLSSPEYYQVATGLLFADDREVWYEEFDFDVRYRGVG